MKAEIIPVGTEILLGNIIDTNSSFLANQLPLLGIDLYFISTVGDNQERLVDTLKQAWQRADLIIVTGGLGPTQDDITREAIGNLLDEELKTDEKLWQEILQWRSEFSHYPGKIAQSHKKQAATIPSAQIIRNRIGTAPGWWIEKDDHIIIALPGPPEEMKLMWQEGILPRLKKRVSGEVILSRVIKTFQIGEPNVDELVAPLSKLSNPTLATYANPDGVYLRITAKARGEAEAQRLISQSEEQIRKILSSHIWGVDDDTPASIVGELLKAKNLSLATMESCTKGLLCNTIASGKESHTYFKGGMLVCCNEAKAACGVDISTIRQYGEESVQVVSVMAKAARSNLKADIGMSIGGYINSHKNFSNILIGLSSDKFEQTFTHTLRGNPSRIKQRAIYEALLDLRNILLEEV